MGSEASKKGDRPKASTPNAPAGNGVTYTMGGYRPGVGVAQPANGDPAHLLAGGRKSNPPLDDLDDDALQQPGK
ncbi:MAG: hypothetical protein ACLQGP_13605 [Isosphaeraceae bacterium]